jgi:hypothetical protein
MLMRGRTEHRVTSQFGEDGRKRQLSELQPVYSDACTRALE